MNHVYLSLGSNLGDRIKNINKALSLLEFYGCDIKKKSSLYLTKPMYYEKQNYFINMVSYCETKLNPDELLKVINSIDKELKRERKIFKGPRTIDVDILYFNDLQIDSPLLKIPHPLRLERIFVLLPLKEIAPSFKDIETKKEIKEIISKINYSDDDIIKIPDNHREMENFLLWLKPKKIENYNLLSIKKTLLEFDNPQKNIGKIIHITGSNGKTTTSYMIDFILRKIYKKKTGLYTSPHILDFKERIKLNGKDINTLDFLDISREVISKSPNYLSYFEFFTAVAIIYFARNNVEFSIIEVGLGGLSDATNVVKGDICVFTKITHEHKNIIGPGISDILRHKAGIIKMKSQVIVSNENCPKIINYLSQAARKKKALFLKYKKMDEFNLEYNKENFELALNAVYCVFPDIFNNYKDKFKNKLKKDIVSNLPFGRYENMNYNNKNILIDGAHNYTAFKKIFSNKNKFKIALLSFMKDKDIKKCLSFIEKRVDIIILSKSYSYRSFDPERFYKKNGKYILIEDPIKAFDYAVNKFDNILVSGSLYFISDIKSYLAKKINIHPHEMLEYYFKDMVGTLE